MSRIAWLSAALLAASGCAQVPGTAPAAGPAPATWRHVTQFTSPGVPQQAQRPAQQQGSPFQEVAKAHPQLRPQIAQLEARLQRLSELQGRALAAAMWNDIKDKTMSQMRELQKSWKEQPTLYLESWGRMLAQVEGKADEELQALAAQLPPDMAQGPRSGAEQPPTGM